MNEAIGAWKEWQIAADALWDIKKKLEGAGEEESAKIINGIWIKVLAMPQQLSNRPSVTRQNF